MNRLSRAWSAVKFAWTHGPLVVGVAAMMLIGVASPVLRAQGASTAPRYRVKPLAQIERLVAPIALYPDALVAEVLAASTRPTQVVAANHWLRAHERMSRPARAYAVNREPWEGSVKALIAFPTVLGNLNQNRSWMSALGEAFAHQAQAVLTAVQTMRARARAAGHLTSTPEQAVTLNGRNIVIEPVSPDYVYVPEYDPWAAYGASIEAWPKWYRYPGIWVNSPYVSFAKGFPVGFARSYQWGWRHWTCDWVGHFVRFDKDRYIAHFSRPRRSDHFAGAAPHSGRVASPLPGKAGSTRFGDVPGGRGDARHGDADAHRGPGYRLGARYRLHPGGAVGSGLPLHRGNRHHDGIRLGSRYRFGRDRSGFPLHRGKSFPLTPRGDASPRH